MQKIGLVMHIMLPLHYLHQVDNTLSSLNTGLTSLIFVLLLAFQLSVSRVFVLKRTESLIEKENWEEIFNLLTTVKTWKSSFFFDWKKEKDANNQFKNNFFWDNFAND